MSASVRIFGVCPFFSPLAGKELCVACNLITGGRPDDRSREDDWTLVNSREINMSEQIREEKASSPMLGAA